MRKTLSREAAADLLSYLVGELEFTFECEYTGVETPIADVIRYRGLLVHRRVAAYAEALGGVDLSVEMIDIPEEFMIDTAPEIEAAEEPTKPAKKKKSSKKKTSKKKTSKKKTSKKKTSKKKTSKKKASKKKSSKKKSSKKKTSKKKSSKKKSSKKAPKKKAGRKKRGA